MFDVSSFKVTDFGLARLHSEWVFSDDKHLLGTSEYIFNTKAYSVLHITSISYCQCWSHWSILNWLTLITLFQYLSRYLAPEFFTDGKVTEKVDIYAFGLVLLELITGKKTSDFLYYKGQSLLLENSYPSATVEPIHILAHKHQLLDSNLASTQLHNLPRELQAMGFAASLCLQREPDLRPPMSKVFPCLYPKTKVVQVFTLWLLNQFPLYNYTEWLFFNYIFGMKRFKFF